MGNEKTMYTRELLQTVLRMRRNLHSLNIADKLLQGAVFAMVSIGFYTSQEENNGKGIKVSDLSRILGISRPAVTKMINSLEDTGCVTKSSTKDDRRFVYVTLTPKGYKMIASVEEHTQVYTDKMLNQLGYEDFEKLIQLLNKVCDIFAGDFENEPA